MKRTGVLVAIVAVLAAVVVLGTLVRRGRRPPPSGALSSHSALASLPPATRPRPASPGAGPAVPASLPSRPAAPAGLRVESDVPGADVFVDREYKGKTPLTIAGVAAGPHRLNVSAEGFDGYAETIDVTGQAQTLDVRLKEVRLQAGVEVVHKHGLGSCHGRLSAPPAGLRYETSKAEDAFDVPLASVERLSVDYPKKTLTAKLRGGRTYNFTGPDGNADALLAFQQAVTKAQGKMASGK